MLQAVRPTPPTISAAGPGAPDRELRSRRAAGRAVRAITSGAGTRPAHATAGLPSGHRLPALARMQLSPRMFLIPPRDAERADALPHRRERQPQAWDDFEHHEGPDARQLDM